MPGAFTVALIAVIAVSGLGLSVGAAILLGAILAPTDPVQLERLAELAIVLMIGAMLPSIEGSGLSII